MYRQQLCNLKTLYSHTVEMKSKGILFIIIIRTWYDKRLCQKLSTELLHDESKRCLQKIYYNVVCSKTV